MRKFLEELPLGSFLAWLRLRLGEPSTWTGFAMIAVVLGSDPMQANSLAQAISLIIGGGLVAAGPAVSQGGGK
jgi:hypothetical protein